MLFGAMLNSSAFYVAILYMCGALLYLFGVFIVNCHYVHIEYKVNCYSDTNLKCQ